MALIPCSCMSICTQILRMVFFMKRILAAIIACVTLSTPAFATAPNPEKRSELTTIGAIRWDAWYASPRGSPDMVIEQVERSLSPPEYHFRAPFFAKVAGGDIVIEEYTQKIFDREMQYAIQAGIDYFAYVWYTDAMKTAREFHLASQYNDQVKMSCVLEDGKLGNEDIRQEICQLISSPGWQTVLGGRPLMYYFSASDAARDEIAYYRQACEQMGVPEPFAVVMSGMAEATRQTGADAISDYCVYGENGVPFTELAKQAGYRWERACVPGGQIVPAVTTGWHNGPRVDNPVSWTKPEAKSWVEYPALGDIAAHLTHALEWINAEEHIEYTAANTLIFYAWNEHDEGGWICPTIEVDDQGNQIFGPDGTPAINTQRVDEIGQVVAQYRLEATEHSRFGLIITLAGIMAVLAVAYFIWRRKK